MSNLNEWFLHSSTCTLAVFDSGIDKSEKELGVKVLCLVSLSLSLASQEEQEDSSWLSARWTGGHESSIYLRDKVDGEKGKLS